MTASQQQATPAEPVRGRWQPDFPLDVRSVLAPLRRGPGDPAYRAEAAGSIWLAANTAAGPGTLALSGRSGSITALGWGPGGSELVAGVPALLGADDDDSGFVAHHPLIAEVRRTSPGLRLGATGRVWDVLVAAILEQKVTGTEAHRSWRELCRRFGTPAPGPPSPGSAAPDPTPPDPTPSGPTPSGPTVPGAPAGLYAPPTPRAILGITDWEWHRAGVDGARRRTLIAAAQVAGRLERAAELRGSAGRTLLRKVPGIGRWTAAEVAQRAWGDPDAVSVGDLHIPSLVGYALLGRRLDDAGMLEVLAPYAPQRQRVVRYIEAAGTSRPRFAPRFSPRDYRKF